LTNFAPVHRTIALRQRGDVSQRISQRTIRIFGYLSVITSAFLPTSEKKLLNSTNFCANRYCANKSLPKNFKRLDEYLLSITKFAQELMATGAGTSSGGNLGFVGIRFCPEWLVFFL
jgi:hypothetical protein